MIRKNNVKLSIWITEDFRKDLKAFAEKNNKTVSVFVRDTLKEKINNYKLDDTSESLKNIIHRQIKETLDIQTNRIVKLVVKAIISSESSNYNTTRLVNKFIHESETEIREKAYLKALNYLKQKKDET